jgi:Neurotransmitter-gated ion-channel ligand binding domain
MGSLTTIVLAAILAAAPGGLTPEGAPTETSPPLVDGKPVEVLIGFYTLDFARVTAREESFDVTGYLELSWRDPMLATSSGNKTVRRLDGGRIWMPRVFFENALEQPRYHEAPTIEVDGTGMVTSWAIVSGKFSSPMELRRFPFDRQALPVRIGAFDDTSVMKFAVKHELVLVGADASLTDWTVGAAAARVDTRRYVPGEELYARYIYQVQIARHWTFYVWRVMVPLTLLALVAWAAFWFEPVGLQPQISTCMASLISLVAFNFAIDFSLPKVTYLTLIDKHALIGIVFVVAAVAAVTLIHRAVDRGQVERARSLQRLSRWLLLPGYVIAAVLNLVVPW